MIEDMVKGDTKEINMKVSKKRLTQIVTEELKEVNKRSKIEQIIQEETKKYLKEEASDCVKDYRLGGMSREEYCACLEHFGEQC